ncbi:MAG: PEP-CTERM sorting domain-containing protein [Pseudomonadota bacterium]
MKKTLALITLVSASVLSGPSNAMPVSFDLEYTGYWELDGGGSLLGTLIADEGAAVDGVIDFGSELLSWTWDWTGNSFVSAFSMSSFDAGAEISNMGANTGIFVDGTPNLPGFADGLDQGVFTGGDAGQFRIDFEFLTIEDRTFSFPFGGDLTTGDTTSPTGMITTIGPIVVEGVPEPATYLLFAAAAAGVLAIQRPRRQQMAGRLAQNGALA